MYIYMDHKNIATNVSEIIIEAFLSKWLPLSRAYKEKRACNSLRAKTKVGGGIYWKSTVVLKIDFY